LAVFVYVATLSVSLPTCCIREHGALIGAVIKGELLHYFDVLHEKYVQLTVIILSPPHDITQFNGLKIPSHPIPSPFHPFV
jgi:hypothetical protein